MNEGNAPQLELRGVTQTFPGLPTPILQQVDLHIHRGDTLAITGPSGSGKSTLIHLMAGLTAPTKGKILFGDSDLCAMTETQRADFRNTHIGLVFQEHHLLPQCTALENALLPTLARKDRPKEEAIEQARSLFDWMDLSPRMHHRPAQLSGGERQRVALIRSLINTPQLLLADEPTGSLDQQHSEAVVNLLQKIHTEFNISLVVATHDQEVANAMGRKLEVHTGNLVAVGGIP